MKKYVSLLLFITFSISALAQNEDIKIVFDVTSGDTDIHASTLRHIKGMSSMYPNGQFEVVIYSSALNMLLKDKSTVADEVASFADNDNVQFVVCAMTMKRYNVDETALIKGVRHVPDGILEIVQKQSEGWGYIKEAN